MIGSFYNAVMLTQKRGCLYHLAARKSSWWSPQSLDPWRHDEVFLIGKSFSQVSENLRCEAALIPLQKRYNGYLRWFPLLPTSFRKGLRHSKTELLEVLLVIYDRLFTNDTLAQFSTSVHMMEISHPIGYTNQRVDNAMFSSASLAWSVFIIFLFE